MIKPRDNEKDMCVASSHWLSSWLPPCYRKCGIKQKADNKQ